jgi:hypothetical protein
MTKKAAYLTKGYHQTESQKHYWANKADYQRRHKIRRDATKTLIREAKEVGYSRCDEKDVRCLDLHHLHGKDMPVSEMLGMNEDRVRREIAKCIVLCANCHRKEHIKE